MNKLDEIIEKLVSNDLYFTGYDAKVMEFSKKVALEFTKHILEDLRNNPDCNFYDEEKKQWMWACSKDSIIDTLNKYL